MPHDFELLDALRTALERALAAWHGDAALGMVESSRLTFFAHELALRRDDDRAERPPEPHPAARAWVASAPCRTARHFVVAVLDSDGAQKQFAGHLQAAARLRSYLTPEQQSELVFLLVVPGSTGVSGVLRQIERNESFGRVLVWTPSTNSYEWCTEADRFVARLQLCEFELPPGTTVGDLSPVDAVFLGSSLTEGARSAWREVLSTAGLKPVERVGRLLQVAALPPEVLDAE